MITAETETTQEINYRECDTIQMGLPPKPPGIVRLAGRAIARRWDRIWPPLVGVLLGTSAAAAFWLLVLLWWINH
ncbi:hypothetical protein SEA_GALACTICA_47 [Streptomyces phage Galactica]|nr:hypothetical protein SEA_GALACTICA_47 [Streptomyces phage Galactica]